MSKPWTCFALRHITSQGDSPCPINNLTKLLLTDALDQDRDMTGEYDKSWRAKQLLIGLILIARADYELVHDALINLYSKNGDEEGKGAGRGNKHRDSDGVDGVCDYFDASMLPPVEDEGGFDEYWERPVDVLIHPPYFDPMMHLLQHNRHLRPLTVHHFPSWSEQAIRAICREGLPLL